MSYFQWPGVPDDLLNQVLRQPRLPDAETAVQRWPLPVLHKQHLQVQDQPAAGRLEARQDRTATAGADPDCGGKRFTYRRDFGIMGRPGSSWAFGLAFRQSFGWVLQAGRWAGRSPGG